MDYYNFQSLDITQYIERNSGKNLEDLFQNQDIIKNEMGEFLELTWEKDDIPCETHAVVSSLSAGEVLVQFEQDNDIDEIIIGVRRRSKVGKLLFGSNAQYVILQAKCPVVAVK